MFLPATNKLAIERPQSDKMSTTTSTSNTSSNNTTNVAVPQEFILEAFADPASVRDVVRGILHAIFFHRYFPTLSAQTHEVLDLTLPYVAVPELETLIDQRTAALVRELDSATTSHHPHQYHNAPMQQQSLPQQGRAALGAVVGGFLGAGNAPSGGGGGGGASNGGRGQISVQFMEKTRRKKMWYKGDEEVLWETWTVRVTVAEPKTDSERAKVRKAMESTLLTTVMKIITSVNTHKEHIPPILTTETNPFPYSITVNQNNNGGGGGWGGRFGGIY